MNTITKEIQQLQSKIIELEKQQKIQKQLVHDKKTSINHNFNILNDFLTDKKMRIERNRYSKSARLARYYDQQSVIYLEAIYNSLKIIDERLIKLEKLKLIN